MNYNKLEHFISKPRIDRFLLACGNSKPKAEKLYEINLRVAQASYPILSLFETFLRNSINHHISHYFSDTDWIINQKNGFIDHPSLTASKFYMKKCVQSAENTIVRKGSGITVGKVIAEQSFGFWTSLFDPHHYRLIGGSIIHCFTNKPSSINRSSIAVKLNGIREFRNRVYHNEPICFNGNSIDFTSVQNILQDIYEILEWMDSDLKSYVKLFDKIDIEISAANYL